MHGNSNIKLVLAIILITKMYIKINFRLKIYGSFKIFHK